MDSRQGCAHLGIERCCRVTMVTGPFPPFDEEADKIKDLREVVWSAVGAGGVTQHNNDRSDLDEVLRMAGRFSNISGAVLDDFFAGHDYRKGKVKETARHSVASIRAMRERLRAFPARPLDLWMVWYVAQLDYPVQEYLDLCDVITMWTWDGSDLAHMDANLERVVTRTPGKRRLAGCYLWNYGEHKPFSAPEMQFQCEKYLEWIKAGLIEGIIFCANCTMDIGLEAADWTRRWVDEVGDEEIRPVSG